MIIDEQVVRDIIPSLRRAGAQGIVEYPLNKVILRETDGAGIRDREEDERDPDKGRWKLDGEGTYEVSTGIPFFNHMLELLPATASSTST